MSFRSGVALLLLVAAGCTRQEPVAPQANAAATATSSSPDEAAPAQAGPVKAGSVDRTHAGEAMPKVTLTDLDGRPAPLGRGKPLLVNLWATWCAPCVAELPSLDLASKGVAALAVNQGEDAPGVSAFLAKRRLGHLRPLLDPVLGFSLGLSVNLPTTILYDAAGKEIWRVSGGRDWGNAESRGLLAEAG